MGLGEGEGGRCDTVHSGRDFCRTVGPALTVLPSLLGQGVAVPMPVCLARVMSCTPELVPSREIFHH